MTDSGLCTYQGQILIPSTIPRGSHIPIQLCLLLYSFCASLVYSLIMWLLSIICLFSYYRMLQIVTKTKEQNIYIYNYPLTGCSVLSQLFSVARHMRCFKQCYAAMCPAGFQGAVRSCQVHQLKQGTHVGCRLLTLFNITDITNSLAEPHFKATWWVLGELLKVNTVNWLAFPMKYKAFNKYNTSTTKKRTLNCRVWVNKINNNILLLNKRKKQKNNSGKSQEGESLSSR